MTDDASRIELAKIIAEAVRAAVAVQSNALDAMLSDDAVLAAEEKAAHSGYGSGLDDSLGVDGGGTSGPWQFSATNGWQNRWVQVGYEVRQCPQGGTDDGLYYVKVNLKTEEMELVTRDSQPAPEIANDTVYLYVGRVEDGKQAESICAMPVAYKYI